MVKKYVITFSISVLVMFSISIILLMIMVPQNQTSITASVEDYEKIDPADYEFVQTKDITKETLVKEYTITSSDLEDYEKYNKYVSGNSDPFTPSSDLNTAVSTNNEAQTNESITNSNGGIKNPSATNK